MADSTLNLRSECKDELKGLASGAEHFNEASKLSIIETQKAIKLVGDIFAESLSSKLNLMCVTSPLFVDAKSGVNDDLNGYERPVTFDTKSGITGSVVQSLAKWKRMVLKKYNFEVYTGLYANMNAIRRDEDLSPLHSYYVDQWDWEKVIKEEDRNIEYLKSTVKDIYRALKDTERKAIEKFPSLRKKLPDDIVFISAQQLEDEYPELSPSERENKCTQKYGAVFLMHVGKTLKSGQKHDGRAPDYDDWELNGDILVYHDGLEVSFELSSMGIRVSRESLLRQLEEANKQSRLNLMFHKMLVAGELPFTIGGGIGKSRVIMYLLDKMHVGEVQVSVWDEKTIKECNEKNIILL